MIEIDKINAASHRYLVEKERLPGAGDHPPTPAPTAFCGMSQAQGDMVGLPSAASLAGLEPTSAKPGAWCTLRSFAIRTLRFGNTGVKGSEEAGIQPWEPGGDARGSVGLPQGEVSPGGPHRPVKSPDF